MKVDASYLSPHVNIASQLESESKRYCIPLLMSDTFVSGFIVSLKLFLLSYVVCKLYFVQLDVLDVWMDLVYASPKKIRW